MSFINRYCISTSPLYLAAGSESGGAGGNSAPCSLAVAINTRSVEYSWWAQSLPLWPKVGGGLPGRGRELYCPSWDHKEIYLQTSPLPP